MINSCENPAPVVSRLDLRLHRGRFLSKIKSTSHSQKQHRLDGSVPQNGCDGAVSNRMITNKKMGRPDHAQNRPGCGDSKWGTLIKASKAGLHRGQLSRRGSGSRSGYPTRLLLTKSKGQAAA
jgi:hypothetical protein